MKRICPRPGAPVRSAKSRTPADARILVNDRLDVALAAGADGVHLGEDSFPAEQVTAFLRSERHRGLARQGFLVGVSTHSAESAKAAEREGANYIFFGPVFATPSKAAYGPPQGTGRLAEVCRQASIPVLAIGGITERNAGECFEAGAAGIAAIRMFQEPADLAQLMEKLQALARGASKSAP